MNSQITIEALESVRCTFYVGTCSCGARSPMYSTAAAAKANMTTHIRRWCKAVAR